MSPAKLTGLTRPLAPLVIHEALEVSFELVIHFNSPCLYFVGTDEWEVSLPILANVSSRVGSLLFRANVEVCSVHVLHLLQLLLFLPLSILFLNHRQLFEEFLFLLLSHLGLTCILGQLVPNLF